MTFSAFYARSEYANRKTTRAPCAKTPHATYSRLMLSNHFNVHIIPIGSKPMGLQTSRQFVKNRLKRIIQSRPTSYKHTHTLFRLAGASVGPPHSLFRLAGTRAGPLTLSPQWIYRSRDELGGMFLCLSTAKNTRRWYSQVDTSSIDPPIHMACYSSIQRKEIIGLYCVLSGLSRTC